MAIIVAARAGGEMLEGFDDHAVGVNLAHVLGHMSSERMKQELKSPFPGGPTGGDGDAKAFGLRQEFEDRITRGRCGLRRRKARSRASM